MTKLRRRAGEPVHGFDPAALRRVRQERGLTLDALGDVVRATRSSLIAYEKGSRRPGLETLRALADALGVESLELTAPGAGLSLSDLRVKAGFTKADVAARLGMGRPAWDRIERGQRPLQPAAAAALAGWFGVAVEEVIAARDRGLTAPPAPTAALPSVSRLDPQPVPSAVPLRGGQPPADSFVGRERELTELADLIHRSRPLTLTGSSGVGKTRLALELIRKVAAGFPDGAWLVELAATRDPALVPQAVASAVGVREQPRVPLTDTLVARLRDSRALLVLDNCEHLATASANLLARLLTDCAGLCCVVTSQQPLSVLGERLWPVPPLSLPEPDRGVEVIGASEAVRLFCERASASGRGFVLTPRMAPAVADICRRLDGIPLAIELAAARVGVLTPAEIAARLDNRFALLTGGGGAGRHQTLQAALQWSYELLPPTERMLLRRLSVFVGGAGIEAVEFVCGAGLSGDDGVLDLLAALVAKSLVAADTTGDRARYRLLETVRIYASDRAADAGETRSLRSRHVEWCLGLAEAAEAALTGPEQVSWLERLEIEHDNLRSALTWATGEADSVVALRLSGALTLFWRVRGYFREGLGWLETALALEEPADMRIVACALRGRGFLALMLDDAATALDALERALGLDEASGDVRGQARSLLLMANARAMTDPVGPAALFERSVVLARQVEDHWCLGHALAMLARVHISNGNSTAGRQLLEECVSGARDAGELQSLRIGLYVLGNLALARGELARAEALLTEGLEVTQRLAEPFDSAAALQSLGWLATVRGDYVRARGLLNTALTSARQTGKPAMICTALCLLGVVSLREHEVTTAERLFEEGANAAASAGLPRRPRIQHGLGEVAAARGDTDLARSLFDEALELARSCGDQAAVATALASLGELSRRGGNRLVASARHQEALLLRGELGDLSGVAESMEAVAGLAEEDGRWEDAARLLAAAQSLRDQGGFARSHSHAVAHSQSLAAVQAALGPELFADSWARGEAMSVTDSISFARRDGTGSERRKEGWGSLTRAERGVAALVAEGLNNTEISKRLFVTRSTVEGHVSHIFAKLGLESRAQLVRESVRREMTPAG